MALGSILDNLEAQKDLNESDFTWLIQLYTSQCLRELYDIYTKVNDNPNSEIARNITNQNLGSLIAILEKIIGGENIKEYLKISLDTIVSIDKNAQTPEEKLLAKTAIPLILLHENNTHLKEVPKEQLFQITKNNYENSMQKFLIVTLGK